MLRKAFSLLELLTVIVIIAIISSFAIPTYHSHIRKNHVSKIVNKLGTFKVDITEEYTVSSSWPSTVNGVSENTTSSNSFFPYVTNFRYDTLNNIAWYGYQLDSDHGSGWIFIVIIANDDQFDVHCGSIATDCTLGHCNSLEYFPEGCSETDLGTTYSFS